MFLFDSETRWVPSPDVSGYGELGEMRGTKAALSVERMPLHRTGVSLCADSAFVALFIVRGCSKGIVTLKTATGVLG